MKKSSVSFRITKNMARRFAVLTGDRNPLHVDDSFGGRSLYRQPIAPGLLALCFLPFHPLFSSRSWRLSSLQARFLKPVLFRDPLVLEIRKERTSRNSLAFAYGLRNAESKELLAEGRGTCLPISSSRSTPRTVKEGSLTSRMRLNSFVMEDIEEGAKLEIPFRVSGACVLALRRLVKEGLFSRGQRRVRPSLSLREVLALLMISPSVGMLMPGTWGTLLEFHAAFTQPMAPERRYLWKEKVIFVSPGSRTLKKEVEVPGFMEGWVVAGIRSPLVSLPSFAQVRKGAKDWGLKGKAVLITGGNTGIGATLAKLFASLGAKVVVNYLRGEREARGLVEEIRKGGGKALAVYADITEKAQVERMVRKAVSSYGSVDVLVNNAVRDFLPKDFLSHSWEDVEKDMAVTLKGSFFCCQAVLPFMIKRGGGRIVNIGSIATDDPPSHHAKYVVAKSGLVGLTRALAVEYAKDNILVNMVVPSMVETDLIAHIPEGTRKKIAQDSPLSRYAIPLDVARAVVFLASAHASFTTGQRFMVTGGLPPFL